MSDAPSIEGKPTYADRDIGENTGLVIGVPSRGLVRLEWACMLKSLTEPLNYSWAVQTTLGKPVDQGRNMIVRWALDHGANYVFFLDDDVLVPNQGLRRMVYAMDQNPEWDLLSGIYVSKDPHAPNPMIFEEDGNGSYWDWKFGEIFPIWGCGMGCCLIRASAFEKVEAPWFEWRMEGHGLNKLEVGEDLGFCDKLKRAGGVLMADGALCCGHMDKDGTLYSLPFDSRPIQTADLDEVQKYTLIDAGDNAPLKHGDTPITKNRVDGHELTKNP